MKISIIVPSYNQPKFIEETLQNLKTLKDELHEVDVSLEILIFDNCSTNDVQLIIEKYSIIFDLIEIENDNGQFDAINKGILKLSGDYWTWLNTDDLLNIEGCIEIINVLKENPSIDYIFGDIEVINEVGITTGKYTGNELTFSYLSNINSSINQPGSFFRTEFTRKMGLLKEYCCCFDYEYILRLLKNNGRVYKINSIVSKFRYYPDSKSGEIESRFVNEQIEISRFYGRNLFSYLTLSLYQRKFKILLKKLISNIKQPPIK